MYSGRASEPLLSPRASRRRAGQRAAAGTPPQHPRCRARAGTWRPSPGHKARHAGTCAGAAGHPCCPAPPCPAPASRAWRQTHAWRSRHSSSPSYTDFCYKLKTLVAASDYVTLHNTASFVLSNVVYSYYTFMMHGARPRLPGPGVKYYSLVGLHLLLSPVMRI